MGQVKSAPAVVLLDPRAEPEIRETALAPRLGTLKGATIALINALIDEERSNGDLLTRRVTEILLRAGVGQVLSIRKQETAKDMPEETLAPLISQSRGAIILEGD